MPHHRCGAFPGHSGATAPDFHRLPFCLGLTAAEAAKRKGTKVYHLNIGQPDIETPDTMINAIHTFSPKVVEYSHSAGIESYRKKLTTYYKRYGIDLDYTEIIITTGGSEAIEIAMMSCMDPGDEIIIPEPFYAN